MKKIISLLLVLAMCAALFAGCTPSDDGATTTAPTETTGAVADTAALDNAKSYVYNMYKEDDGGSTVRSYSVVSVVSIGTTSYDIQWAIEVTSGDAACLELSDDGTMATVSILNAKPEEEVVYNLVGTIADEAGNSVTVTFKHNIPAAEATGVNIVDEPVPGTAYKYIVEQNELGAILYFAGEMSGYYMATTENPFDAVDVYVEETEGGLLLYFMDGETKTYINLVPREDAADKANIQLVTEPTCVYTWDAERDTLVAQLGEASFYIGTYSTYNTFSVSNFSYIEDASKIGVSQFPAGFCTVNIEPTQVAEPVVGTGYKFALVQGELGQTLYFTGEMSGYYLAMSQNPAEGVEVYMEEAEGGYYLTYTIAGTKTYIDIVPRGEDQPGKVNVVLVEAPSAVYTWDSERKTFVTTVDGNDWYMGTYNTYNTISASNTSYIEDVSKIGDSQFPAGMYTIDGFAYVEKEPVEEEETESEETESDDTTTGGDVAAPEAVTSPVAGTAYKWGMLQETVGKVLYFAGTTANKDYYLATTDDVTAATDVYLEEVEGGYHMYFTNAEGTKTYIDMIQNGTYLNISLTTEPTAVLTWSADYNTFIAAVGETQCYIGTYSSFETLSCSDIKYIDSSYPTQLYTAE